MTIFSLNFSYAGVYCGVVPSDEDEAQENLDHLNAEKQVKKIGETLGYKVAHQYGWPDGSLYKWVRTDKTQREVTGEWNKLISEQIDEGGLLRGVTVTEDDPNSDPWKSGCKTLAEYMDIVEKR